MTLARYSGERARFAAEYLNSLHASGDPIVRDGEGAWRVMPAPTAWDRALGGRKPIIWSDEDVIALAEHMAADGGEDLDEWTAERRAGRLA